MSTIHVKTLVEALERPSTLKSLMRKTGYPIARVISTILEARMTGTHIQAVGRKGEPTYYKLEVS